MAPGVARCVSGATGRGTGLLAQTLSAPRNVTDMRTSKLATAVALLGLILAAPSHAATPRIAPTGRATEKLALAMLKALDPGTDAVFSPYSVATAMAMVDQGASGQTAAQIDTLLGSGSPAAAGAGSRALADGLHHAVSAYGSGGPTFDTANGLWLESGLTLEHPFATTLSDDFGAAPQQTHFASDPAGAIQTINHWISARTGGLIPSLLGPAQLTPTTKLVLANAVYLNARWQTEFDPNQTTTGSFAAPTGTVMVPFMHGSDLGRYRYGTGSGYRAVALPYAHSSLQLLAVMPPPGQLDTFEGSLSVAQLNRIVGGMSPRGVTLSMPKFSLSFQSSLNGFLEGQGVTQAFGPQSRLDRIVAGHPLAIQAVEHAAVLKVAERGTVAAAATGITVGPTAVAAHALVLVLNHPFLIFLRDTQTGTILFAGRVENPASS
jgi:serpin B